MMPRRLATAAALAALAAPAPAQAGWTEIWPTPTPPPRTGHALAHDAAGGRTVLFGGFGAGAPLGDTWCWDGAGWTAATPPASPPPRLGHVMAYHPATSRIVMFGGGGVLSGSDRDDTWEFDGATWQQVSPAHRPGARRMAQIALDPHSGHLLLFGGGAGQALLPTFDDTWHWNGADWSQLQPANRPPARARHAMAGDPARSAIVMFGGSGGYFGPTFGDTWIWNGADWSNPSPSPAPVARRDHTMSFDSRNQTVVLQGGPFFDTATWHWDGARWFADTRHGPPALGRHAMANDVQRQRNVLFDGSSAATPRTWEYDPGPRSLWTPGGSGCPGTLGVPTLARSLASPVSPSYDLELRYPVSATLALFVFGLDATTWQGFGLPLSLAPVGMPGCDLHVRPDATALFNLWNGSLTVNLPFAGNVGLAGLDLHAQAFVLDAGANPAGAVASNSGTARAGMF